MRRSRRSPNFALVVFLSGMLLTLWAASGAATVSAVTPTVTVNIEDHSVLKLYCADPAQPGFKDGFCRDGGNHLVLDFDRGMNDVKFGMQPGSRYIFGDVMFIENIWTETIGVTIRVEQEEQGSLYQVLMVDLTDPLGDRHPMFPPDPPPPEGDEDAEKTILMAPGDVVALSFGFDLADDWAAANDKTFNDPEKDRFTLTGAVMVKVGIETEDDTPPGRTGGGGGIPGTPGTEVGQFEPPLAGPAEPGAPSQEVEVIDEMPEAGPLPRTGGTALPYLLMGLLMMAAGGWLYRRERSPADGKDG